jgi:predicted ArsR family transcriptional regulator
VKNSRPAGPARPALGPLPASPPAARPPLPAARAALLGTLQEQPGPSSLAALAEAAGLHPNTVREHLGALVRGGLVRRRQAVPSGRGRPAWLYEAGGDEGRLRSEYGGLAATLAAAIQRTSGAPRETAIDAGAEWGHQLARARAAAGPPGGGTARREVVDLLEDIGFAPERGGRRSTVRLTRCPLLEAARRYPDVVCGVHLGIVRGALVERGGDPAGTELVPFAEPGACLLELPAVAPKGRR